jgi:multidrug efflux system membrane fusion protein
MTDRTPGRRLLRQPVPSVALLLLPLLGAACKEAPPAARPAPVVATATAERGTVPYIIVANGEVEPNRFVAVQAQVTGVLTRVAFAEGADVREGQVLFEIDARPFRAELERTQGVLARDEAQLARARTDSARYETLVRDGFVTREQYDQILADVRALSATVAADRAAVERAQFDLSNATVRAPISGRTGQLTFREGNVVRALVEQPLVTINEVRPVLVRFAVPESDFAELRARGGLTRALPVQVRPSVGDTTQRIRGTLAFVDNAIDRSTGAVTLKARVPNADGALWPGQFVQVALELDVEVNAVTIPAQAVVQVADAYFVFTVDADGKVRRTPVRLGRQAGLRVLITEGLQGGEQVIVDGQQRIADGMTVQVRGAGSGGAPGGGAPGGGAPINATDRDSTARDTARGGTT